MAIKIKVEKKKDRSFEVNITVTAKTVADWYQKALKEQASLLEVKGFRKGQVPTDIAEKRIGKDKIYQTVIQKIVTEAYSKAIRENGLKPIIQPRISLISAKEGEDWQIKIISSEMPEIDLAGVEEEIKKLNAKNKIWAPGQEGKKGKEKDQDKDEQIRNIIGLIVKTVKIHLPKIIIDQEVEKKLVDLVDQLQQLGLKVDQYLASKRISLEQLKSQYQQEVEASWKLDLALEKMADQKGVVVSPKEIEKLKDSKINPYLAAKLIRREKTLEQLISL